MYLPEEEGTVSRIGSIGVFGFLEIVLDQGLEPPNFWRYLFACLIITNKLDFWLFG